MGYISQVKVGNTTYQLKDKELREKLEGKFPTYAIMEVFDDRMEDVIEDGFFSDLSVGDYFVFQDYNGTQPLGTYLLGVKTGSSTYESVRGLLTAFGIADNADRIVWILGGAENSPVQAFNFVADVLHNNPAFPVSGKALSDKFTEIEGAIAGGVHWVGVTTTDITDGASTPTTIKINGQNYNVKAGDMVNKGNSEFVWNGSTWFELGNLSGLKALAYKDSASGSFTPAGTNAASAVTLSGGSTGKLATTTVPNVTSVGSASTWSFSVGTGADAETLIISGGNGTAPTLGTAKTVATGQVASNGGGATVATALHTGGTAAAQVFAGTQGTVTVS